MKAYNNNFESPLNSIELDSLTDEQLLTTVGGEFSHTKFVVANLICPIFGLAYAVGYMVGANEN